MIELTVARDMNMPAKPIWDTLADFGNVVNFHPMVRDSRITNDVTAGIGAERRCDFTGMAGHAIERIVDQTDLGLLKIELLEGTMPFKRSFATFRLMQTSAESTRVELAMEMLPKGGPLGRIMARLMMVPMMRGQLSKVLAGLEHYLNTGQKMAGRQAA